MHSRCLILAAFTTLMSQIVVLRFCELDLFITYYVAWVDIGTIKVEHDRHKCKQRQLQKTKVGKYVILLSELAGSLY